MQFGLVAALALSLLVSLEAKHPLQSSSKSSDSGSSYSTQQTDSGSGSKSSSSGVEKYTASSSGSSGSDSGSDLEVDIFSKCKSEKHVSLVVNEPFSKKLVRIAKYFRRSRVEANFIINGAEVLHSLNYRKGQLNAAVVNKMDLDRHVIVIKPDTDRPIKEYRDQEFLHAVQRSAIGIQSVLGQQPRFVHIPGGQIDKSKAQLLDKHGYRIVHWSKTFKSHGHGLKDLIRRRRSSSRRHHRSSRRHHRSSRRGRRHHRSSRRDKKRRSGGFKNEISDRSDETTSSRSHGDRRHGRRHRRSSQKKAKGHIIYGHQGKHLGRDIQLTVQRLDRRGYSFVNLETCTDRTGYRDVHLLPAETFFLP